ncbi:MAG: peptidoglycan DD-metalloendopeptidase family protein [Bermanella sp.]
MARPQKTISASFRNGSALLALLLSWQVWAFPESSPVPGGIVTLKLGAQSENRPTVYYKNNVVAVTAHNGYWHAIVGLSLNTQLGHQEVRINGEGLGFEVKNKDYPEQHITLKTNKHVDLSAADLKRHKGEKKQATQVFKAFDTSQAPDLAFMKPVKGPYSSLFGLKRFFNEKPRNPHSGLDIAAPTGTKVLTPSPGKVVLTGNFFFNGKVVYVDHGLGLISMFCHLNEIDVKVGEALVKGQPLGKVGATGRVTGAHLHWSVSLNNARVDPMELLPKEKN